MPGQGIPRGAFVSRVGGEVRLPNYGASGWEVEGIACSYWQLEMKLAMGRAVGGRQGWVGWVERGWMGSGGRGVCRDGRAPSGSDMLLGPEAADATGRDGTTRWASEPRPGREQRMRETVDADGGDG